MKTVKFSNKLRLQKETIVDLSNKDMSSANGGIVKPLPILTYTKCMTQCPSNDTYPDACCALC